MADKEIFELGVKKGKVGVPENGAIKIYGPYFCVGPTDPPGVEEVQNRYSRLNFTGQPGTGSAIYFSLVFNLPKWAWQVVKADEWIEVTPTNREYFERTTSTKQMLESTIKTGLASAAQAVSDYELMSHDIRKYREILDYFKENDERLLRSMFIDQVDVHTDLPGQPIALRTIVSRWPTIIADFMKLEEEDKDPDKMAEKYDISKAEAVILSTKNKLFVQWKKTFYDAVKDRYKLLRGMTISREATIKEYKEWLKPYISRFKMTRLGGERAGARAGTLRSFADLAGMSTFFNKIRLFVWKPMIYSEHRKPFKEKIGDWIIYPYDSYVRNNIILNTKTGLAKLYPWLMIKRKKCPKCKKYYPEMMETCKDKKCHGAKLKDKVFADQIVEEEILPGWDVTNGLSKNELYYMFIDIQVDRAGTRLQVGELEDITFYSRIYVISQNIMLVKMLELWCRDKELENYIDQMLGLKFEDKDIEQIVLEEYPTIYGKEGENKKKKEEKKEEKKPFENPFSKYLSFTEEFKEQNFKSTFLFVKGGPYETDLKERITKHFLKFAAIQLGGVTEFIKSKMGIE